MKVGGVSRVHLGWRLQQRPREKSKDETQMKQTRQTGAAVVITVAMATSAHAQTSVTLYGIVDNSLTYQSSQTTLGSTKGGRSNIKMSSGVWAGSRFGLKGAEDLGGGTKAIFQLESGFNSATGGQQYTNAEFRRQAWMGATNATDGTFTAGRQ